MPQRLNRIVYNTIDGQVATIAPDGATQRQLTTGAYGFQFPTWSPVNNQIAAIGRNRQHAVIFLLEDDPSATAQALFSSQVEAPIYLSWSPNGRILSFLAAYAQGLGLHVVPTSGGEDLLLATGQPLFWDWADDGQRLLMHSNLVGTEALLAYIGVDGVEWGSSLADPGYFQSPAISKNGRYLAYAELNPKGTNTLVVEENDARQHLTLEQKGYVAMGWAANSSLLAFTSSDSMQQHFFGPLSLYNAKTQSLQKIVDETVLAFFWSPNGRYLAYFTIAEPTLPELLEIESPQVQFVNGNVPPQIITEPELEDALRLNLNIYDILERESETRYSFQPPPVFINQFLPYSDQYARSHTIWAPDSSALTVPTLNDETCHIMIVPRQAAPPFRLADGVISFWSHF